MTSMYDNILISHIDYWDNIYYLCDNLTFTTNRQFASKFSIYNTDNSTILNGDSIYIRWNNRILSIDDKNNISLSPTSNCTFVISNLKTNFEPINYRSPVYLLSSNTEALKLSINNNIPKLISTKLTDKDNYFVFCIEKANIPVMNDARDIEENNYLTKKQNDNTPKSILLVWLSVIILILCVYYMR